MKVFELFKQKDNSRFINTPFKYSSYFPYIYQKAIITDGAGNRLYESDRLQLQRWYDFYITAIVPILYDADTTAGKVEIRYNDYLIYTLQLPFSRLCAQPQGGIFYLKDPLQVTPWDRLDIDIVPAVDSVKTSIATGVQLHGVMASQQPDYLGVGSQWTNSDLQTLDYTQVYTPSVFIKEGDWTTYLYGFWGSWVSGLDWSYTYESPDELLLYGMRIYDYAGIDTWDGISRGMTIIVNDNKYMNEPLIIGGGGPDWYGPSSLNQHGFVFPIPIKVPRRAQVRYEFKDLFQLQTPYPYDAAHYIHIYGLRRLET